jgi:hypothetical protein
MSLVSAHINLKQIMSPLVQQWFIYCLSHLSIHTFVDEGKITIDLFSVENEKIKSIIKDFLIVNAFSIDGYNWTRGN